MKKNSPATKSLWMETSNIVAYSPLTKDITTDVCVIGGGIAGLTAAYSLAKSGRRVTVIEGRHIGAGQTQYTTAHLMSALDDRYSEIERIRGEAGSRIAAESHCAAIDHIERLVNEEQIECDFRRLPGYLFCPPGQSTDILDKELEAAARAGLEGVEIVGRVPLTSFDTGKSLLFPRQGQIHPLKYLNHLCKLILKHHGEIYTGTQVTGVRDGKPVSIETANGPHITSTVTIVATNTPINDMFAIHTKQAPYLTYALSSLVPRGSITPMLMWDTESPYHYVRLQPWDVENDVLIIGGEDHKAGQVSDQTDRHRRLEDWARLRFPMMGRVEQHWSGMVMETIDGAAFIGKNPGQNQIYIATGDSGMGMTHGTIAGLLLTDLINGLENSWAPFYAPSRLPTSTGALSHFVSENINVAKEYVQDWLGIGDHIATENLKRDQGTVVRRGLHLLAVYRDTSGELHEHSAVCPHLGCIVHWNDLEKVWDCPCHGSRFDARGCVINGPAVSPLKSV